MNAGSGPAPPHDFPQLFNEICLLTPIINNCLFAQRHHQLGTTSVSRKMDSEYKKKKVGLQPPTCFNMS